MIILYYDTISKYAHRDIFVPDLYILYYYIIVLGITNSFRGQIDAIIHRLMID